MRGIREERQVEAEEAVGAKLRDQAREDDDDWNRRRRVGGWQPGMKRKNRHLDGEGQGEPDKEELRDADAAQAAREMPDPGHGMLHQHRPIETQLARLREVDPRNAEDGDQHREAADDGVDQEFEGGVDAAALAPDADQEVERNQHRLPEDVEEDEVERQQNPRGRGLQNQEQEDELLQPRGRRVGDDDRDQKEQRVQAEQEETQAVDPEVIADPQRRDPAKRLLELEVEAAHALLESPDDRQYQREGDHRGQNPELFDHAPGDRGCQCDEEGANQGHHQDQGQPGNVGGQRVPAHAAGFQGKYPRKYATMPRTPTAPPSVTSA